MARDEGGAVPIQLPVFPEFPGVGDGDAETLPVEPDEAPPEAGNKPVDEDRRFKLAWSKRHGWVLVPAEDEDEAEPK